MHHNIAIVDDESFLLESLEWVLMDDPYNVFTFQNPVEALEELNLEEIAVVVSDLMMPEMDGATLLKEVNKRCPEVECLMMTAIQNHREMTEIDVPVITKPWDVISFRTFINEAVVRYEGKKEANDDAPVRAKRILFIDDDPYVMDVIQEIIKFIGYEVVTFQDCTSAFELLKSKPNSFDLVITDMNMPHMNGIELSKKLIRIKPDLPIILCTGNGESVPKESLPKAGIKGILSKPFSIDELRAALYQVLD